MKKNLVLILMVSCFAVMTVFGVLTDLYYYKYKDEQNYLKVLNMISAYTNCESLGLIDIDKISQENDCLYHGPAIRKVLCERAGISEDSDTWNGFVDYYEDMGVCTFTVYEDGQDDVLTFQKVVKARYIYGEI